MFNVFTLFYCSCYYLASWSFFFSFSRSQNLSFPASLSSIFFNLVVWLPNAKKQDGKLQQIINSIQHALGHTTCSYHSPGGKYWKRAMQPTIRHEQKANGKGQLDMGYIQRAIDVMTNVRMETYEKRNWKGTQSHTLADFTLLCEKVYQTPFRSSFVLWGNTGGLSCSFVSRFFLVLSIMPKGDFCSLTSTQGGFKAYEYVQ